MKTPFVDKSTSGVTVRNPFCIRSQKGNVLYIRREASLHKTYYMNGMYILSILGTHTQLRQAHEATTFYELIIYIKVHGTTIIPMTNLIASGKINPKKTAEVSLRHFLYSNERNYYPFIPISPPWSPPPYPPPPPRLPRSPPKLRPPPPGVRGFIGRASETTSFRPL